MIKESPPTTTESSCCCGPAGHPYAFMVMGPLREEALTVRGEHLVLDDARAGTPLYLGLPDDGSRGVTLAASATQVLGVVDGLISVGTGPGASWLLEADRLIEGSFHARHVDGGYLAAAGTGAPMQLTGDASQATVFVLSRVGHHESESLEQASTSDEVPNLGWAAEPDSWRSSKGSTHYWLFERARALILDKAFAGGALGQNLGALRMLLGTEEFVDAVARGINAADNSGDYDAATSGFIYSAHFYDHERNRGGFWDPNPKVNAYNYGRGYFGRAVAAGNVAEAGRALGLSIHYLTDVCQPMHAVLFPNNPVWKVFGGTLGYQHSNYEFWTLAVQSQCALPLSDLDLSGHTLHSDWWMEAAKAGRAEGRKWGASSTSPINGGQPQELSIAEAKARGRDSWIPSTRTMLRLAQTLTVGLILSWADQPAKVITNATPANPETMTLTDQKHGLSLVAGIRYDGHVYHQARAFNRPSQRWLLEQLKRDGRPWVTSEGRVVAIRDEQHHKYLVAGETADNNVYHQNSTGAPNCQWALQPVKTPEGEPVQSEVDGVLMKGYHLIDQKHHLCLVAGDTADNHLYHQAHRDRPNAVWFIAPARG